MEGKRQINFSSTDSLTNGHNTGMGEAKTGTCIHTSHKSTRDQSTWEIFCYFPRCISMELN